MCNENLLIIVISILHQLILCDDIETNPGPKGFKNCPKCDKKVHSRSKICSSCKCYVNKQIRGVSKPKKIGVMSDITLDNISNTNIQLTTPTSCKSSKTWAKCKEQINARRRLLYKESPERKRNNSRKRYHMHASPVRKRVLEAYYSNPSPVKKQALDAYYNKHHINKAKKRQMYKVEKGVLINKHSIATLNSCSISKKYSKLRSSPSKLASYV